MIPYLPLKRITELHAEEIHEAVARVVDSGWYLRGEATTCFEADYARYIGTKHCIGVANGLDALTLILRAYIYNNILKEGDEVIVPANTYIATILSITENRLKPVLIEPFIDTLQIDDTLIEQAITTRTRVVMIVHLYGRCAFTPRIADICQRHNLLLLEDNAQAHGCSVQSSQFRVHSSEFRVHSSEFTVQSSQFTVHNSCAQPNCELCTGNAVSPLLPSAPLGRDAVSPLLPSAPLGRDAVFPRRKTGSIGHAAAHSFYPGKNLGALGDAGAVTTNDDRLAETIRSIANYGSSHKYVFDHIGRNSRIDELQAAVLSIKLKYLDSDNARRQQIADYYSANIKNPAITIPGASQSSMFNLQGSMNNVFHIYPVFCHYRDKLQAFLAENGIQTMIHYPIPPHKQACYKEWHNLCLPITEHIHAQELSLPCHQAMTDAEVERVTEIMNLFK